MFTFDLTRPEPSWNSFSFPDGQPHIELRSVGRSEVKLMCRIASSDDLLVALMAAEALRSHGSGPVHLVASYLLGARMDRSMPASGGRVHPFTLAVVAEALTTARFASIRLFDPHSDVAPALLRAQPVLPVAQVREALLHLGPERVVLVAPDAGAAKRVEAIASETHNLRIVQALKKRDPSTGMLSGFKLTDPAESVAGAPCLIVDDLVDGGGTFLALGAILQAAGASAVHLYASHGVFSKGFNLAGIDRIFTTDSYQAFDGPLPPHVTVLPWRWGC